MPAIRRTDREHGWWVDFRYCGRRIRRKSPVQTKTGAESFERVIRKRLLALEESGVSPFQESETIFSNFVERWMRDYVVARNRLSAVRSKEQTMRCHLLPAFGALPLRAITEGRIDELVAKLRANGLAPKSINNILSILRTCLASAVRWNLLASVPAMPLLKVPEFTYKYLSVEEVRDLVGATEWQDHLF